jgi:hypothetical protein
LVLFLILGESSTHLFAHQPGLSYINLTVETNRLSGRVDMSLRDLDLVVNLDTDGNGAVTFAELQARQPAIGGYLLKHLSFSADGNPGLVHVREHLVATDNDGAFAVAEIDVDFPATPAIVTVRNRLFVDVDAGHRSLMQITLETNVTPAIFVKDQPEQTFKLAEPRARASFATFFKEGVWHIWIGYDHILFLVALLLPAVMTRDGNRWQPVREFKPAFINIFKIVTAFTIAHSITLGLAASALIQLPGRFVESAIAFSVILAAANNIKPFFHGKGWFVAFCFGILHGFGFASVLGELDLQATSLFTTLVGFNLGVEAGQLAIVAIFMPLAFSLRDFKVYQSGALVAGSATIALLALIWLIERAFDISIIS